jgi:endo-1,4-beta-xylanase
MLVLSACSEAQPPTTNDGVDDQVDLTPEAPEAGEKVPPDLGQPIPTIAPPGFPAGSPARLVPMQFVGPITGLPVLFNIYLPPGYDSGSAAYPVLYDLHGLTDSRDTNPGPVIRSFEASMRNAVVGPLIVVFPQSFVEAYYADSRDGARPGETQIIRELIPFIDQSFRTLAHRARRGVSGFSMGGFGAFAYATKYPDQFSVGIGYDSALDTWETLVGRRAYIATAAFGNDESHFDQISPWANAARNAAVLTESSTLRIVPGVQYRDFNEAFRGHLAALAIPHEITQTDCPHDYDCVIDREGARSWAMIQAEFSKPATESAP